MSALAPPPPRQAPFVPPPGPAQAERLIELGVPTLAGLSVDQLRAAGRELTEHGAGLLTVHPDLLPASGLVPLVRREDRTCFVVHDLTDLDAFAPLPELNPPATPLVLLGALERGDELANRSPDETMPLLREAGRTPLLISEALHWLIQVPTVLERNHCFMAAGSRRRRPDGRTDRRVPAVWISNGTGRDRPDARGAPKVGWCWAGNRHTWLGFASAATRTAVPT